MKKTSAPDKTNKLTKSSWIPVTSSLPDCNQAPDTFGVPVLIYPPFNDSGYTDIHQAYYGTRVTDKPSFYLYGRVINVTHWMYVPEVPCES